MLAALLRIGISDAHDRDVQKTQYVLGQKRNAADAIHPTRIAIKYGEVQKHFHLVLLDWDKALDKVEREEVFTAMERMGIRENSSHQYR